MDTLTIMGIDPGSTELGLSFLEVDMDYNLISVETHTLKTNDIVTNTYVKLINHGDLSVSARIGMLTKAILELVEGREIYLFVLEEPHLNSQRPKSYIVLARQKYNIQNAIFNFDKVIEQESYSVQEIKKSVGAAGKIGKEEVVDAMKEIPEIMALIEDIDTLSDHEVDAIAAAYTGILARR